MVDIHVCDTTRRLIVELFINLLVKTAKNNYLEQQQQQKIYFVDHLYLGCFNQLLFC